MAKTNKTLQKGAIQEVVPIALLIILLIAIVIFLFYYLKPPSRLPPVSVVTPEQKFQELLVPLIEKTEDAYNKISGDLPYIDPDGNFIIQYLSTAKMFTVDTQARAWEEYAERRRLAAQFFRDKGVDPCKIHVIWGSDPVLLNIPRPAGLDFGCPVSI
jgi:hypothetical protein